MSDSGRSTPGDFNVLTASENLLDLTVYIKLFIPSKHVVSNLFCGVLLGTFP